MNRFVRSLLVAGLLLSVAGTGCKRQGEQPADESPSVETDDKQSTESDDEADDSPAESSTSETQPSDRTDRSDERKRMVRRQIEGRNVDDPDVLDAMERVPRHRFVPQRWRGRAYADTPLPIGHDQTISQPFIVATMTEALDVDADHEVLEIGTGSGYQAAILAELADHVYTIEIVCDLAERARETLESLDYANVDVRCGDGYEGWPNQAPFDRIIVTAAPDEVPEALVEQLAAGGRMVVPVGDTFQELRLIEKTEEGKLRETKLMDVRFVPMVHGDTD